LPFIVGRKGSLVMSESERRPGIAHLHAVPDPPASNSQLYSCTRELVSAPNGLAVVLRVVGEIDRTTEPLLRTAVGREWPYRFAHLVVDLTGVTFCSRSGFALLTGAALRATLAGAGMAVTGLSPELARHADLIWIDRMPVRYPSVAHAVMAFRAGQCAPRGPTTTG
jgi:anti-sigma B factor antagonist